MKFDSSNALEQVNQKISVLNTIKEKIENTDFDNLLNLFYDMKQNDEIVARYITDTRDILAQICNYLNSKFDKLSYSVSHEKMSLNSENLNIRNDKQSIIGQLSLRSKSVSLYRNPFQHFGRVKADIAYAENRIPKLKDAVGRYHKELEKYKKTPKVILLFKRITFSKLVKMEEYIGDLEVELKQLEKEYSDNQDSLESCWKQALDGYADLKKFLNILESKGFTHDYYDIEEKKDYRIYYRYETNHSHSGNSSFESGHISILNIKQWESEDITSDSNFDKFKFTKEEFNKLHTVLKDTYEDVSMNVHEGVDSIVVKTNLGRFSISKHGLVAIKGEDFNLHHIFRHKEVSNVLFLKYKSRNEEDFQKANKGE